MPRYNVKRPSDGKWACYSTVVDDYVTDFMDEPDYRAWREKEYGRQAGPLENANRMEYAEAERARARNCFRDEERRGAT